MGDFVRLISKCHLGSSKGGMFDWILFEFVQDARCGGFNRPVLFLAIFDSYIVYRTIRNNWSRNLRKQGSGRIIFDIIYFSNRLIFRSRDRLVHGIKKPTRSREAEKEWRN